MKTLSDLEAGKPEVKLAGEDGNAYSVMGRCQRAAREYGCNKEEVDKLLAEMMAGDYNMLLATAAKYFEVI